MTNLYIRRNDYGYLVIEADGCEIWRYLYYTKREALRRYREQMGLRYKHLRIYDFTKERKTRNGKNKS